MVVPVIISLNMMDEVEKAGDKVDAKAIEKALGVTVVEISALKGKGIKTLMTEPTQWVKRERAKPF